MSRRTLGPRLYIEDMSKYCDHIIEFTSSISLDDFKTDLKTQLAVVRAFEVLGEAAKRIRDLPSATDPALASLPLQRAYETRNRFIHGYDTLNLDLVWEISVTDVPKLKADLDQLLASWPAHLA